MACLTVVRVHQIDALLQRCQTRNRRDVGDTRIASDHECNKQQNVLLHSSHGVMFRRRK